MRRAAIAGLSLLALLGACAVEQNYQPAAGEKMPISQQTWQGFKEYQGVIGAVNDGAFAVSSDGRGYYYRYCPTSHCVNPSGIVSRALHECERDGAKCYLFARGNAIKVDYQVMP